VNVAAERDAPIREPPSKSGYGEADYPPYVDGMPARAVQARNSPMLQAGRPRGSVLRGVIGLIGSARCRPRNQLRRIASLRPPEPDARRAGPSLLQPGLASLPGPRESRPCALLTSAPQNGAAAAGGSLRGAAGRGRAVDRARPGADHRRDPGGRGEAACRAAAPAGAGVGWCALGTPNDWRGTQTVTIARRGKAAR
jgi:hypothetical protein